jgi:polyhydroxybutyrate depolymerase
MAASAGGRASSAVPEWRIPDPVKPLPLLVIHGLTDDDIPFAGGRSEHRGGERTYLPVDASIRIWVDRNGCAGPPVESSLRGGAVRIQNWENCQAGAGVTFYGIEKWGHVWPGPYFTGSLPDDDPLQNFDAAEIVWQFFKRYE